jgi:ribonuclease P protein component
VRTAFAPADEATSGLFPQVGYAIGRRCGSAVVRNRLRRRARAVVREQAPSLPRGAFLVRLEPGASALTAAQFRHDLATALRRAGEAAERP